MEEMVYEMEAHKTTDTKQLIHTSIDSKAPELELVEIGEFSILHQFYPPLPLGNYQGTHSH